MTNRVVPLEIERHTLHNGLRLVLHRDSTLPLVAISIWYHVGSKHEKPGRTGLAHLFEHLLFQGSAHVDTNGHFRHIQLAGGVANGSTWFDRTNYYETLPAHHLDLGLWLEADRMGWFLSAITQEKLDKQREVVINERRQKMDNQPYGRAFERLHELLYPAGHPYRWPVIGYIDDLVQTSLEDVRHFFHSYYAPNNAVLTLAGNFEPEDARERVERFFGEIPRRAPVPSCHIPPDRLEGEHRAILRDRVTLPRVYLGFHGPAYGQPMWYAADLLCATLAEGKSSPLYQDLVYHRRLAQELNCFILPTEEAGTFALIATAQQGVDPHTLEEAILQHLLHAAQEPISEVHLARARHRLLTAHYSQMEALATRADLISQHTTYFDAPERLTMEAQEYQRLSAEHVKAFVREYCQPDRRATVWVVPQSSGS